MGHFCLATRLRIDAAPRTSDLLVAAKGPGHAPAIPNLAAMIHQGHVGGEATAPIVGNAIVNMASVGVGRGGDRRRDRHRGDVAWRKDDIHTGVKGFGAVTTLPDVVDDMLTRFALGQRTSHLIAPIRQGNAGNMTEGRRFQIRPSERLGWVIAIFGDIEVEIFGGMGGPSNKAEIIVALGVGGNGRRHPVVARQIQPGMAAFAAAAQLAVGDDLPVAVVGVKAVDRAPIIELLGAGQLNGGKTGLRIRIFRVFQVTLVDAADRVFHGAMCIEPLSCGNHRDHHSKQADQEKDAFVFAVHKHSNEERQSYELKLANGSTATVEPLANFNLYY